MPEFPCNLVYTVFFPPPNKDSVRSTGNTKLSLMFIICECLYFFSVQCVSASGPVTPDPP